MHMCVVSVRVRVHWLMQWYCHWGYKGIAKSPLYANGMEMTVCMCHGQDISHNDNLSQPADTPDMEYERHADARLPAPYTHTHTITYDLPLPRSPPFLRLSLLHGVLINKFINGLLIMSAYLPLKHWHCPQTPISAQLHTHHTLNTHTHTHTHTHSNAHTQYVHIYIKPFSHTLYT